MALMLFVCGCRTDPDSNSAGTAKPPAQGDQPNWTIGMSQCNLGEPWRVQMNADVKAAADSIDEVEVVFKDAQNDTLKQRYFRKMHGIEEKNPVHSMFGKPEMTDAQVEAEVLGRELTETELKEVEEQPRKKWFGIF